MFVFSCKTTKKQIFWTVVCILLLAVLIVAAVISPENTADTATVTTAEEGVAYLQSLGYEATGGEVREIRLPDRLDGTLAAYNELLRSAGLDLTPYLGKQVQYRTYTVKTEAGDAPAHLYIYRGQIIGGDVTVNGVPKILKPKDSTNGTAG